jgi:hypothetical protein
MTSWIPLRMDITASLKQSNTAFLYDSAGSIIKVLATDQDMVVLCRNCNLKTLGNVNKFHTCELTKGAADIDNKFVSAHTVRWADENRYHPLS